MGTLTPRMSSLLNLNIFPPNILLKKGLIIPSYTIRKKAILTGQFSLLSMAMAIFYSVFDAFVGIPENVAIYIPLAIVSIAAYLLNRNGHFFISKIILLLAGNTVVFLFATREAHATGSILIFIPIAIAAITLFGYERRVVSMMFVGLSIFLSIIVLKSDFTILRHITFSNEYIAANFIFNLISTMVISSMAVYFLIDINYRSEKTLLENENRLRSLTEELEKSRNRFELAIKGSSAGIWDVDFATNTIYTSPLLRKMIGFEEHQYERIELERFFKRIHLDDVDRLRKAVDAHLKRQWPFRIELRIRKSDNTYGWFLDSGQAEWDEAGQPMRMVGSLVDITLAKKAQEEVSRQNEMLAKANSELDRFVYSTSHDLRAPLSSVLGLIHIIEKETDPKRVSKCIEMMKERVETLDNFIQEIIDYSRNTRVAVSLEPVMINELVESCLKDLKYIPEFDEIEFKKNLPKDLVIKTDRSRLKVILNNLLSNAIKYHDPEKEKPFIKLSVESSKSKTKFIIEDNGIGISKDYLDQIFDMFFRATESSKGSGLGLYIVKEMIEKLNGTIQVFSEEKKGTRFEVSIPNHK